MEGPELGGEQQFCLRWNNFQANITSQFEALRDDEDFVDVTLACEGHRLEAHKVVLSACSPYFKELFKSNPCPHPIIFMRDCELIHITALLEFMYAGEVNIAQAQLTSFLRTAEALQIRGLTDSSDKQKDSKTTSSKAQTSQLRNLLCGRLRQESSPAKDSSQNVESNNTFQKTAKHLNQNRKAFRHDNDNSHMLTSHNGVSEKNQYPAGVSGSNNNCEMKDDALRLKDNLLNSQDDEKYMYNISENNPLLLNENEIPNSGKINPFAVGNVGYGGIHSDFSHEMIEPKIEVPDYTSEDESRQDRAFNPELLFGSDSSPQLPNPFLSIQGDIGAGTSQDIKTEVEAAGRTASSGRVSCPECGRRYSNLSNLRQHVRLIHRSQPVACPLCSRSFKTQLYLRRHTLSQHVKQNVPPDTLLVKINKGFPAPVPSVNSIPVRPVDLADGSKTELNALNGYDSSGDCDASLESADVFKMEEDAVSIIDDSSRM